MKELSNFIVPYCEQSVLRWYCPPTVVVAEGTTQSSSRERRSVLFLLVTIQKDRQTASPVPLFFVF